MFLFSSVTAKQGKLVLKIAACLDKMSKQQKDAYMAQVHSLTHSLNQLITHSLKHSRMHSICLIHSLPYLLGMLRLPNYNPNPNPKTLTLTLTLTRT